MAEWLSEEREVELIDMWQASSVLYEVISKEYSNRNKRMVALMHIAVLPCRPTICPSAFSHVFVAAGVADDAMQ